MPRIEKTTPYGVHRDSLRSLASDYEPGLVSVVIPCHNAESYVEEALNSIFRQTYSELEVVVVDDGSTDGSFEVLNRFRGRIKTVSKENGGASAARNDGLEIARGEFIQFLDADDYLLDDAIESRLGAMTANVDAVFGNEYCVDANGQFNGTLINHRSLGWPPKSVSAYLLGVNIRTPLPLHRRQNVYRVGGFDEKLPRSQEPDLHLRLYLQGHRFAFLDKEVAVWRQHESSSRITSVNWMERDPSRYVNLAQHWKTYLEDIARFDQADDFKSSIAKMLYGKAAEAYCHGFREIAEACLLELDNVSPDFSPKGSSGIVDRFLGRRFSLWYHWKRRTVRRSPWMLSLKRQVRRERTAPGDNASTNG